MSLSSDNKLLALSRSDCSIEVWLKSTWIQLCIIPGNVNAPIRNLHWLENTRFNNLKSSDSLEENPLYFKGKKRRLISTGLSGVVIEWDLLDATIRFKHSI